MSNFDRIIGGRVGRGAIATFAAASALALSLGAAVAQQAPAAPAAPAGDAAKDQPAWLKVCGEDPKAKKEVCVVAQEIRAETGQFLASVAIREIKGDAQKVLSVFVPTIMLLQPGLRVQIDDGKQVPGKYAICFPDRCYAEIPVDDNFIAAMKKGTDLSITTLNQQARGVSFKLTLSGFTKSYDGAPMDTKELEAQQEKLQDELQKRAEDARKRLLEQQAPAPAEQPKQ
ncbi:MAG: invasion associated locus B family protein [Hyphomicrobiales bacterium]